MNYPITDASRKELDNSYTYHAPKDDQADRYVIIRDTAKELAMVIIQACPPSRERSVALTNLEQAVMWANKAIACNE